MRTPIRNLNARTSIKLVFVLIPWLLLIGQNYMTFKFPIKTDRYQHSFSGHFGDRAVAYLQLFRSPYKAQNSRMEPEVVSGIVLETGQKYHVDPCLIESIVTYESDFNPNNISTTGAMGLMALMPITAEKYGVRDPFYAVSNIDGGTRLVRDLLETFNGDVHLALAAYNAGDTAVKKFKGVPPYRETIDYVKFVGGMYELLRLRSEDAMHGTSGIIDSHATKTQDDDVPIPKNSRLMRCSSPPGSLVPPEERRRSNDFAVSSSKY